MRLELGSNEAVMQAVAGGLGLAVVSQHAVGATAAKQGLAVLSVKGLPIQSQWHIVRRKGKALSPIAAVFEKHLLRANSAR